MFDLYHYAEAYFKVLVDAGRYLIDYDLSYVCSLLIENFDLPDAFLLFLNNVDLLIGDFSIAGLVIGWGLWFVIIFKAIKFFTDIVL